MLSQDTLLLGEFTVSWLHSTGGREMYTDIYHHCHSCLTCASFGGGAHRHHPPLQPLPVVAPFERVGILISWKCPKLVKEIVMLWL